MRSTIYVFFVFCFASPCQSSAAEEVGDFGARFYDVGTDHQTGAIIHRVRAGGPAAKAGIVDGDVIRLINGKLVTNTADAYRVLAKLPAGTKVGVWFERRNVLHEVTAILGRRSIDAALREELLLSAFVSRGRFTVRDKGVATGLYARSFAQTDTGRLVLEINGRRTDPFISASEATQLDGTLEIRIPNYDPKAGDKFEIVGNAYFFLSGRFSRVALPRIDRNLSWQIVYDNVQGGEDYDGDGLYDVTLVIRSRNQSAAN